MKIKLILNIIYFSVLFFQSNYILGKNIVENYEPKFWWTGMKYSNIIVAARGNNLNKSIVKIDYPGVTFNQLIITNHPNIVFFDIEIKDNAITGIVPIKIYQSGKLQQTISFVLKSKA